MVEITSRAEELLLELRGKHGYDQTDGVRFQADAGSVRFAFTSAAKPRDRILDGAHLQIFIAPELAERFNEARIDAQLRDGKQKIVVTRRSPEA